ncbi:MAG: CCA tRNA nucleotidyltransferase [Planctomycetota bacterium]
MEPPSNAPQRAFALEVVGGLRDAGHEALFAGGCVRDALLGKTPKDYDVATSAEPGMVRDVFGKRRTIPIGAAFGVITVLGPKSVDPIEVATFRSDTGYSDGRRPDAVRFTSAEEDAKRRDFTINGLFFDPIDERVIDYVGGRDDLKAGVVRAIGDADERIAEDRLRMLRAVRFASTLGFQLEDETHAAVRRHAEHIRAVSAERIGAELRRMLVGAGRVEAVRLLETTGLRKQVLAEANPDAADRRLAMLESPTAALALAAAVIDTSNAPDGASVARRLKWTAKEADTVGWCLRNTPRLAEAARGAWSALQPLLAAEAGAELVELYRTDPDADPAVVRRCRERLALPRDRLDPPPLLVGADLIACGLQPGPRFAELLGRSRAAQLDGAVATKDEALRLLRLTAG